MRFGIIAALSVLGGIMLTLISFKLMQILQLSSYRFDGVCKWLKRTRLDYFVRYFALSFFSFVAMFVVVMCFSPLGLWAHFGFAFFVAFCGCFVYATNKQKGKTPLKFTCRIIRLSIIDFVLNALLCFASMWFTKDTIISYSLVGVTPLLVFVTLWLSHIILLPLERLIGRIYINKATQKLALTNPIVIGITGSYGKTTAKKVLASFLHAKYTVFASPNSYNTPMGLSKCINEEYGDEQIFVAEFGARRVGDVKYLKKIFKPQYAMLTAIGNQHLETFGSKENIVKEKISVLDGVKYAVTSSDVVKIAPKAKEKADVVGDEGVASYSNATTDIAGTRFTLTINGENVEIYTRLVGDHIPSVITMCALMAVKFGVSLKQIKEISEKLPFVDHRLEVMRSGDMIIFDDSYNSNPVGAENALRILSTYNGTKVIVTPGFVELGKDSLKCARQLGKRIAEVCDYAFLLGPYANEIKEGMGDYKNARIVESLPKAMEALSGIAPPLAVLFENDLPDNY